MPRNTFQRAIFALITVIITVHAYVFYSLFVVNGDALTLATGTTDVLSAISTLGGVYVFGRILPVWVVVLVEFAFAFSLEMLVGSPCSLRIAKKAFNPQNTNPVIFETAIICSTVLIMCPAMSFIASFLYYPYNLGFNAITLLTNFLELVCYNFPFAFFTQIFFIQPLVRTIFKFIFKKSIKAQN